MSNENIVKHLEDIDQVLCDSNAQMGNVVSHLGRIALALEALVEQGKNKKPVAVKGPVKKADAKKEPVKKVEEVKTDEVEEPAPEQSKTYTHEMLKASCLTSARADSANRDKLKALLSTYGATKAVDVPVDKLAEVIGKIEAGEF